MGSKSDNFYIQKILGEIEVIIGYTKNLSYIEFMSDGRNVDATMFRLQQMIEHIKNLSIEFKQSHDEIPWGDIIGFRNGIVHEYGATDYSTVYEIITNDIYKLKTLFEENL